MILKSLGILETYGNTGSPEDPGGLENGHEYFRHGTGTVCYVRLRDIKIASRINSRRIFRYHILGR